MDQSFTSFEENKFILGIFIAFKKAFDMVDYSILPKKINDALKASDDFKNKQKSA